MSLSPPEAREALVTIMHRMHASGLNRGTSGNASIRVDGGMIVTPSGVPPEALSAAQMVFVGADGAPDPAALNPSSEFRMHHFILRARVEAQAVVHCHSRYATILACCHKPIAPIHYMILVARAPVISVAPYATFGSEALAASVVQTMGPAYACLMANHGQVTIGGTWQQALAIAEEVEEQAAVTYGSMMIGGAVPLTPDELGATVQAFSGYGQARK